jgi:hypothetical protein
MPGGNQGRRRLIVESAENQAITDPEKGPRSNFINQKFDSLTPGEQHSVAVTS